MGLIEGVGDVSNLLLFTFNRSPQRSNSRKGQAIPAITNHWNLLLENQKMKGQAPNVSAGLCLDSYLVIRRLGSYVIYDQRFSNFFSRPARPLFALILTLLVVWVIGLFKMDEICAECQSPWKAIMRPRVCRAEVCVGH